MSIDATALPRWMHFVLRLAGWYNIAAGLAMMIFYHEGYRLLGIAKPELTLPIQLVGMLVAMFGIAYLTVDRNPLENRNLLRMGFWSKTLGPILATGYIIAGVLPWSMLPVLLVADVVYLYPFYRIDQRIGQLSQVSDERAISGILEHARRRAA